MLFTKKTNNNKKKKHIKTKSPKKKHSESQEYIGFLLLLIPKNEGRRGDIAGETGSKKSSESSIAEGKDGADK